MDYIKHHGTPPGYVDVRDCYDLESISGDFRGLL